MLYTAALAADQPSRIGFIVSKSVGNAVVRNLVKRRLREAGALSLQKYGSGFSIVVRALPAAAGASWEQLLADYDAALESTIKRLGNRVMASSVSNETTQEGTPRA